MLKPITNPKQKYKTDQPPLGGCVLKQAVVTYAYFLPSQPPLGGCVLKRFSTVSVVFVHIQPPLGGCVLKRAFLKSARLCPMPAAFRRLCVETLLKSISVM